MQIWCIKGELRYNIIKYCNFVKTKKEILIFSKLYFNNFYTYI